MMKTLLSGLLLLVLSFSIHAKTEETYSGTKQDLVGYWISKSIDGDALFFIVSQLSGQMDKDNNFAGTISYTDFQTSSVKGSYRVEKDHVFIETANSKKPYKLKYWFQNAEKTVLVVEDEKFGVTLRLKKTTKAATTETRSLLDDL